ncbi:hypothetical protein MRB53_006394 [Persea americana]|uniref:Uncharacterized protein n=1 Tax=Persea americana TaxID=3435 RepID=A0ACC2MGZ8_PERAE|nr:hypothetical protein MRB53_006394 [Persea americana]
MEINLTSGIQHKNTMAEIDSLRIPTVEFTEKQLVVTKEERSKTLIGQLQGQGATAKILLNRLPTVWQMRGELEVLELPNKLYLFNFNNHGDLVHARFGSPWTVVGQKLLVTNWTPNFDPSNAYIAAAPIWVLLPGLPIEYLADHHSL